jgi:hypothetical protein
MGAPAIGPKSPALFYTRRAVAVLVPSICRLGKSKAQGPRKRPVWSQGIFFDGKPKEGVQVEPYRRNKLGVQVITPLAE